jgi:ABC-2 type transport system permease protein
MIPRVICLILTVISTNLTASAIVRERERGTLEQVMVTPLSRLQFILGKLFPYIVISFIDITVVITLGMLIFSVPMRGSFLLLYLCAALFLLTSLGIGLFISTISRTQQQAMLSSIFFTFPAITLSGFMYPISNMPKIFQYINCANPLRWFIEILRGIMLKGNGIDVLWPQILALSVIGFSIITLSVMRFQKRIG